MSWSTERPVVLHRVLVRTLAHVMHTSVPDGEALLHDVVHEVNPEGHLLMVVTWSKGEGHLAVSGVHHVFVPLGEVVGNAFQQGVHFCGDGQLRDNHRHRVGVFGQFPCTGELHHLLKYVGGVQRLGVVQALDQRLDLIEVCLFSQEVRLREVHGEGELGRAQEVQDVPEKSPIAVDEIISLGIPGGGEVSPEHGPQHGVWIALQGGQTGGVEVASHIQGDRSGHLDQRRRYKVVMGSIKSPSVSKVEIPL